MIKITDRAQRQLIKMLEGKNLADHNIRIGARGKDKCALNFYLGIQKELLSDDKQHQVGDLTIIIDRISEVRMKDVELDYIDLPEHSGFVFRSNSDMECSNSSKRSKE
jgi:Fe-S cluster assembly iron-binding protein IscA